MAAPEVPAARLFSDMASTTFILTGMPRSGTTYLAALLHNPPRVITQSEAGGRWKQLHLEAGAGANPLPLVEEMRRRIARGEPVPTLEATAGYAGAQRIDTWNQKKALRSLDAAPDFALGVKNPEVFLAWVPRFVGAGLRCVISIRHPVAIMNSWVKQEARKRGRGRAPADSFSQGVSVVWRSDDSDPVQRRIDLHNFFAARVIEAATLPGVMLARYEAWFEDGLAQLRLIGDFLGVETKSDLIPPPLPPDPIGLPAEEQERILAGCAIAKEYGYSLSP